MLLLIVLCLVVLAVAAATVLVRSRGLSAAVLVRSRKLSATSAELEVDTADPADPAGPVYGLVDHGPNYAPQPVVTLAAGGERRSSAAGAAAAAEPQPTALALAGYQPHRPVVTSAAGARVREGRGGAHRRESDAEEIARLDALHEAGALSDDELASLKARLS